MASTPPAPEASLNLVAELTAGTWSIYTVPTGAHTNADRTFIGSGKAGSGIMFPANMIASAYQQQAQS